MNLEPPFSIRPATPDDLPAVNAVFNAVVQRGPNALEEEEYGESERREWFAARTVKEPVLVAVQGDQFLGWCSLSRWGRHSGYRFTAEHSVYVKEPWRWRGIGTALVSAIIESAVAHGYRLLIGRMISSNDASRALHRRCGFSEIGTMHGAATYRGSTYDVILMERPLTAIDLPRPNVPNEVSIRSLAPA